jgi:surface carbohydrate biosynthesis protein
VDSRESNKMNLFQALSLISKSLRIKTPPKAPVLIFDIEGSEVIINLVLKDIPYSILPVRTNFFYLSPIILLMMIRNFNYYGLLSGKKTISLLFQSYLYSFTKHTDPSIVITYIDNNPSFHWLSRNYSDAQFFAVQNGVRNKSNLCTSSKSNGQTIKKISMPNLICFGQNDADNYTHFGHEIDNYYCKGSLKGSYYQYCTRGEKKKYFLISV